MPRSRFLPGIFLCCTLALPASQATETAPLMQQVFDAIAYLLPLSLREDDGSAAWDRTLVDEKLATLEQAATAYAAHAKADDAVTRDLAQSFADRTQDIAGAFREAWPGYAWFSLMELTQHCVACHSRLPAQDADGFAQRLLARLDLDRLDASELAQLLVATRQFDAALAALERKLANATVPAVDLDNLGVLVDYLDIALVVRHDPARVDETLARFLQRDDVPYYLHERITRWRRWLAEFGPLLAGPASLVEARRLFLAADPLTRTPRGRERAIHDLVAASLLERYLHERPGAQGEDVGEAWYMLGVIALRTTEPRYSVPGLELNLAAAIRAAPHGTHAREAYALLEEFGFWRDQPLVKAAPGAFPVSLPALRKLLEIPGAPR